jgi:hypothetical protein
METVVLLVEDLLLLFSDAAAGLDVVDRVADHGEVAQSPRKRMAPGRASRPRHLPPVGQ